MQRDRRALVRPVMQEGQVTAVLNVRGTKIKDTGSHGGVLGPHTYRIDAEGLHEVTPVNEGLQRWAGVQEVGRSKRFVYIRINSYLFHLIPRHAFASDREFEEFGDAAHAFWTSAA